MNFTQMSIKSYALSFILVYVFIFLLSSLFAFSELQTLNDNIEKNNLLAGKAELSEAIEKLALQHKKIAEDFSNLDEVRQQLDKPKYYSYWQTHRLMNSELLPSHILEACIYNQQGKALGKLSHGSLPETIDTNSFNSHFTIHNNEPELISVAEVYDPDDKGKILGYVSIKSKALMPLLQIEQFNHVKRNSISPKTSEQAFIDIKHFINHLSYDIKKSNDSKLLAEQVKQIIFRNTIILVLFALLFYFLLSHFFSRPLRQISNYIDALNNKSEFQDHNEISIQFNISELEKVKHSLSQYQKKLQKVYVNLDDKNRELWEMAHHDALTGALNRRAFEKHWSTIAELFSESRCHISLILFDVNRFKSINDSYGHPVGDEVLKKFASVLESVLRQGDKIYRIGGDEFATTLYNCTHGDALTIALKCQKAINEISYHELGIKEPIRASIGVANNDSNNPNSFSDLLWQADIAVYEAKKPGQSHVIVYSEKIKNISSTILSSKINNIVFNVIESGSDICMFYQPIINLGNEMPEYYEALLRIKSKDEIILPGKIFQLVEARKLEHEFDLAIFKQIANDLKQQQIPLNSGVSINVSGPSIISPKIIEQLAIFAPYLKHFKIILEITETSLITNINNATDHIIELKKMGFLIALDDFGSGYSSISYLSHMPVDIVKFDITLINQLEDKKQYSIISHLAKMIKETGHLLVAEGIETTELRDKIKHLDFNYAQGFFYGKPTRKIP